MVTIKGVELTPEQVLKGMECKTPEEMMAICKEIDIDVTKEEAQTYIKALAEIDLTPEQMKAIAGGYGFGDMAKEWKKCAKNLGC